MNPTVELRGECPACPPDTPITFNATSKPGKEVRVTGHCTRCSRNYLVVMNLLDVTKQEYIEREIDNRPSDWPRRTLQPAFMDA